MLRSIPPMTALRRTRQPHNAGQRQRMPARNWAPRGRQHPTPRAPHQVRRRDVVGQLDAHLRELTDEIERWLPEFGESALLLLYEERARLAEILASVHDDWS